MGVLREHIKKTNLILLIFLVLVLNVKLVIKLLAIAMLCFLQPGFKFGFSFKQSRLPLFYPVIILIAIINAIVLGLFFRNNYLPAFALGIGIWIACILVSNQLKLFTGKMDAERIHSTILVFFLINAAISIGTLAAICIETGSLNPYLFQGNYQKYFISTGDYIKGVSFDTSTTNAALNAMGIIYFLYRGKYSMMALCLFVLILTGSNLLNLMIIILMGGIFIATKNKTRKSIIACSIIPFIIFWARVSPQNNQYLAHNFSTFFNEENPKKENGNSNELSLLPFDKLTSEQQKERIARNHIDSMGKKIMDSLVDLNNVSKPILASLEEKKTIPQPNIHTAVFQHKDDTSTTRKEWIDFTIRKTVDAERVVTSSPLPGKIKAWIQSKDELLSHPEKILAGFGMGNFSSRNAFKTTSLNIAGNYPAQLKYIDPVFEKNHLALYLSYFTMPEKYHSVINTPNSVFNQMISEYGIAGLSAFMVLYLGFFLKKWRLLTYGLPMIFLMTGLFFTEYWFEQLSIVFLFELLLFTDMKKH